MFLYYVEQSTKHAVDNNDYESNKIKTFFSSHLLKLFTIAAHFFAQEHRLL